jgi:FMN phosphatase YigB (HAD superfamily)
MNTCIFDLDGTLLPMPDQELFLDTYFKVLAAKFAPHGYDPGKLTKAVWTGTKAMLDNDGTMTNEQRFWSTFEAILGEEGKQLEPLFDEFYRKEFHMARSTTLTHPNARECVRILKEKGYTLALATNPLFPRIATYARLDWAGLDPADFDLITTYENSNYCKPKLEYYAQVLENLGKTAQECIMIGNDVKEDMCAAGLGMDTFLLKDCLICPEDQDITAYKQGNFDELLDLVSELPNHRNAS